MKQNILKIIIGIIIVLGLTGIAYIGGTGAGEFLDKSKREELLKDRQQTTKAVLEKMEIKVGDTFPDYEFFETLESRTVKLSNFVTRPTWLLFVQPDCEACLQELDFLNAKFNPDDSGIGFIIISNSNPLDLIDLRDHYKIAHPILHDRHGTFSEGINVYTYPLNVLINKDLTIQQVVIGQLEREDF